MYVAIPMSFATSKGSILTPARGLFICFLLAVFCRTARPLSPLTMLFLAHENIDRCVVSSKLQSFIEDRLQRLKFGYELSDVSANDGDVLKTQKLMLTRTQSSRAVDKEVDGRKTNSNTSTGVAVCNKQRLQGCASLIGVAAPQWSLQPLPCVTEGSCPYFRFRCAKGHEWKAVPGSPVCMHCPECIGPSKVMGKKRKDPRIVRQALQERLVEYVQEKGGEVVQSVEVTSIRSHNSFVALRCQRGHIWSASVGNLILLNTWCPSCCREDRRLKDEDLIATAEYFKGRYLGSKKTLDKVKYQWECELGHQFTRDPNNIRRREGTKRKCSWCPACTKTGKIFIWK